MTRTSASRHQPDSSDRAEEAAQAERRRSITVPRRALLGSALATVGGAAVAGFSGGQLLAAAPTDFATGLSPARLTITVGVGARVFELPGLSREAPRRLRPLPAFAGDHLDPRWGGGDLIVQICADDAQVVSAAM